MQNIMDLSAFNTVSSWPEAAQSTDGVILRCGYRGYGSAGTLARDRSFASHAAGALSAGLSLGAYFVTQAVTAAEAIAEADFAAEAVGSYRITLPVYLDSEWSHSPHTGRGDVLDAEKRTDCALAFCERIRALGYTPGVYASESWFADMLQFSRLDGLNIWCAKYSAAAPSIRHDGWQYTDAGTVPGVRGRVDLSRFSEPDGAMRRDKAGAGGVKLTVGAKSGLRLRRQPVDGEVLNVLPDGAAVMWYGYYCERGGAVWNYVRTAQGLEGYAAAQYLKEAKA